MPELPEVETVVCDLRKSIVNNRIVDVTINVPKLRNVIPGDIKEVLRGAVIIGINRRAKYIWVQLSMMHDMLIHLGMSGSLIVANSRPVPKKHDHIIVELHTGQHLVFNDPRKFGLFIVDSKQGITRILSELGYEPLECNEAELRSILKGNRAIKEVLTCTRSIAGIGNIYSSEILFHARISPLRSAGSIIGAEVTILLDSIKHILYKAVALRGSTIRDYRDSNGESGGYQNEFLVYDRKNKPCWRCDNTVIKIKQNGRATYLCGNCQI